MKIILRDNITKKDLFTDWKQKHLDALLDDIKELDPHIGQMVFVSAFYEVKNIINNVDRKEKQYYLELKIGYMP